jgi:hypothetical protein
MVRRTLSDYFSDLKSTPGVCMVLVLLAKTIQSYSRYRHANLINPRTRYHNTSHIIHHLHLLHPLLTGFSNLLA